MRPPPRDFQGLCLQSGKGSEYMETFDRLPAYVRKMLCNSPFNLCAACVKEITMTNWVGRAGPYLPPPPPPDYKETIRYMEDLIRAGKS